MQCGENNTITRLEPLGKVGNPSCTIIYTTYDAWWVVGDAALESAYLAHPGAFLYVVGSIQEKKRGDKMFLNVRPRGWIVVEVDAPPQELVSLAGKGLKSNKNHRRKK